VITTQSLDADALVAVCADLESKCNYFLYGTCTTGSCLVRGGWVRGSGVPPDYSLATCRPLEQARALRRIAAALPLPAAPVDKDTSATAPAQSSPAVALVELVAEAIISATGSRNAELEACTAIDVVADWLERKHSARIANGSGFADLLREMLEREAGR